MTISYKENDYVFTVLTFLKYSYHDKKKYLVPLFKCIGFDSASGFITTNDPLKVVLGFCIDKLSDMGHYFSESFDTEECGDMSFELAGIIETLLVNYYQGQDNYLDNLAEGYGNVTAKNLFSAASRYANWIADFLQNDLVNANLIKCEDLINIESRGAYTHSLISTQKG